MLVEAQHKIPRRTAKRRGVMWPVIGAGNTTILLLAAWGAVVAVPILAVLALWRQPEGVAGGLMIAFRGEALSSTKH